MNFVGVHPHITAFENFADLGFAEKRGTNAVHGFLKPSAHRKPFGLLLITLARKNPGIGVKHELAIVMHHQLVATEKNQRRHRIGPRFQHRHHVGIGGADVVDDLQAGIEIATG